MFAVVPNNSFKGFIEYLLSFSPLDNGDQQTADAHSEFLEFVFEEVYGKSLNNVSAIIGDNFSTNRSSGRGLSSTFIGVYIHKFHLGVKEILEQQEGVIEKVQNIMHKLSLSIPAPEIYRATGLSTVQKPKHGGAPALKLF